MHYANMVAVILCVGFSILVPHVAKAPIGSTSDLERVLHEMAASERLMNQLETPHMSRAQSNEFGCGRASDRAMKLLENMGIRTTPLHFDGHASTMVHNPFDPSRNFIYDPTAIQFLDPEYRDYNPGQQFDTWKDSIANRLKTTGVLPASEWDDYSAGFQNEDSPNRMSIREAADAVPPGQLMDDEDWEDYDRPLDPRPYEVDPSNNQCDNPSSPDSNPRGCRPSSMNNMMGRSRASLPRMNPTALLKPGPLAIPALSLAGAMFVDDPAGTIQAVKSGLTEPYINNSRENCAVKRSLGTIRDYTAKPLGDSLNYAARTMRYGAMGWRTPNESHKGFNPYNPQNQRLMGAFGSEAAARYGNAFRWWGKLHAGYW